MTKNIKNSIDLVFANMPVKERKKLTTRERNKMMKNTFGNVLRPEEVVYMVLRDHADVNGYQPSAVEIAQSTGYCNATVSRAIRNLVGMGYVNTQLSKNGRLLSRTYRPTEMAPPAVVKKLGMPKTMLRFIKGMEIGNKRTVFGNPEEIIKRYDDVKEHFKFHKNKKSVRIHRVT